MARHLLISRLTYKKSRHRSERPSVRLAATGSTGVDLGALAVLRKELPNVDGFVEAAPRSKPEQKRIARKRGYEEISEDVNKWQGIVHQQRNARQLSFPLDKNSISIIKQDNKFQPLMKTELEKEMYELLSGAEMIKPKEESAEDKAVREAMTLEEVLERNKESWRLRTLRNKLGKKAHIRNKTKSKKFHRILKKDRLRKEASNLEQLGKTEPGRALDKLQKLDEIRIEERMTLKHKKSKWAANLQLRAKTDKTALAALQENSRLHEEMVNKLKKTKEEEEAEDDSEEDDSDTDDSDEHDPEADTQNSTPAPGVQDKSYKKMKTFWGEYNRQKEEEMKDQLEEIRRQRKQPKKGQDEQTIEEANKMIKDKLKQSTKSNKGKKKTTCSNNPDVNDNVKINEYEFTFSSMDKPDNPMNESAVRLRTLDDMENFKPDKVAPVAASKTLKQVANNKKKSLPEVDASKIRVLETKVLESSVVKDFFNNDSDSDEAENDDPNADLFDEDDLALDEFNKAREAAEDAAQPKDVCHALPGWGSWTGPDIKMSAKIIERFTDKAPKKAPSKFSDKKNVIYNEEADLHQNIRNRMVSELPFPFLQVSDWEASIRGPIGRTFVPELVHRKLIEPALVTEIGAVIKPMDQTQLLKDNRAKQAVKDNKKTKNQKKEEMEKSGEKPVRPGNQLIEFGSSKKRKFSRKSVN
uniref:U3 small nucleolar RNA-associated protein 14 homolog A-like n=1 Tax=Hirondellea gigas TaxID=1518452 RepID=A0A6A7FTD2_9CRUS